MKILLEVSFCCCFPALCWACFLSAPRTDFPFLFGWSGRRVRGLPTCPGWSALSFPSVGLPVNTSVGGLFHHGQTTPFVFQPQMVSWIWQQEHEQDYQLSNYGKASVWTGLPMTDNPQACRCGYSTLWRCRKDQQTAVAVWGLFPFSSEDCQPTPGPRPYTRGPQFLQWAQYVAVFWGGHDLLHPAL